jgi:hypothetical protein
MRQAAGRDCLVDGWALLGRLGASSPPVVALFRAMQVYCRASIILRLRGRILRNGVR